MAVKPEEWDEEAPKMITDTAATMPADWLEDELDYTQVRITTTILLLHYITSLKTHF